MKKQILLLAMIHLLIFHQYEKDKKERPELIEKNNTSLKSKSIIAMDKQQDLKWRQPQLYIYDSSLFYHVSNPAAGYKPAIIHF